MRVALQTSGQPHLLASAEVYSETNAPASGPDPRTLSPEARAALARLTGTTPNVGVELVSPGAPVQLDSTLREIGERLAVPGRSLTDPNETRLSRGVFTVHGVALEIPMVPSDAATGARRVVRLDLNNALMPDGTEVARGSGRVTLLVSDGVITGMLDGSLAYDASTTYLQRNNDEPLLGHRGEPGHLLAGAAVVRDGKVVGLAPNSLIDIDGIRIRSGADAIGYKFEAPDLYTLGAGATVLATPADRTVHVRGDDVSIVQGNLTTRLGAGASARVPPAAPIEVDGPSETTRQIPDPAPTPDHAQELARGTLVLRRIPGARLYIDGIKSSALDQIGAGDCYFIGPILSIAEMRPEMIERLITDNRDGTYTVRFIGNDGPVDITVDDEFYMAASGERAWYREKVGDLAQYASTLTSMAYAANPAEPREIWGAVLEKAYAQWKGGYGAIYSGYPDIAMRELTGHLSDTTSHAKSTAEAVFADVQRAVANRVPTVAITDQPATRETQQAVDAAFRRDYGMRNNHVYAVMDTVVENGIPYVVLRNTERLIEGRSSEYQADVDRDGDGTLDGPDGYFRLRYDDYFRRFAMTTTMNLSRTFVPGTKQIPYSSHPIGVR